MSSLVVLLIILAIIVGLALIAVGAYNRLVRLRQVANQAFADIDVQLKQRHDLIPNLVETVKGYATHERDTIGRVVFEKVNYLMGEVGGESFGEKAPDHQDGFAVVMQVARVLRNVQVVHEPDPIVG